MTVSPSRSSPETDGRRRAAASASDAPVPGVAETGALMRFDVADEDPAAGARSVADRFGIEVLQDVEVLGLVLARAGQDNAVNLAQDLIVRCGGLAGVLAADRGELARLVGPDAVFDLKLLRHAASRLAIASLPILLITPVRLHQAKWVDAPVARLMLCLNK
jgi:hypothetical protein